MSLKLAAFGSELIDIFPVAGKGHHCSNRSRSSAVAPAEVLPDMSYYISDTMSIRSDLATRLFAVDEKGQQPFWYNFLKWKCRRHRQPC